MAKTGAPRGRPPAVTRETLQDAAFELFLEQGYEPTTVEQIANRAGVARSTFFNHFTAKSDVFWIELDDATALLEHELAQQLTADRHTVPGSPAAIDGLDGVRRAITAVGETWSPQSVPFVLTQYPLIGSVHELRASALSRLTQHATLIAGALEQTGRDAAESRVIAFAVVAASVAAATNWALAGSSGGGLADHLDAAVAPVLAGFTR